MEHTLKKRELAKQAVEFNAEVETVEDKCVKDLFFLPANKPSEARVVALVPSAHLS